MLAPFISFKFHPRLKEKVIFLVFPTSNLKSNKYFKELSSLSKITGETPGRRIKFKKDKKSTANRGMKEKLETCFKHSSD